MKNTTKEFPVSIARIGRPLVKVFVSPAQKIIEFVHLQLNMHDVAPYDLRLDGKRCTRNTRFHPNAVLVVVPRNMLGCTCSKCCTNLLKKLGYKQIMFTYDDVKKPEQGKRRPFVAVRHGRLISGLVTREEHSNQVVHRKLSEIARLAP